MAIIDYQFMRGQYYSGVGDVSRSEGITAAGIYPSNVLVVAPQGGGKSRFLTELIARYENTFLPATAATTTTITNSTAAAVEATTTAAAPTTTGAGTTRGLSNSRINSS